MMANYIILFIVILPFILIFLAIGFLLLPAKLRTKKLGLDCLIIGGVCGSILALYFVTTPMLSNWISKNTFCFRAVPRMLSQL